MADLFTNLSKEEKDLLTAYDKAFSIGSSRSEQETVLDKLYLLSKARKYSNQNNHPVTPEFITQQIDELKNSPKDYGQSHYFSPIAKIVSNLYEAKKAAPYKHTTYGMWTAEKNRKPTSEGQRFLTYLSQDTHNNAVKLHTKEASSWIYRIPKGVPTTNINHRYAVNARPDIALIQKLTEYAIRHQMYFKTANAQTWEDRIDTIVIYSPHSPVKKEIEELKQIVAPYIRKEFPQRTNDMDGTLIAEGLITATEPSLAECLKLRIQLKNINSGLEKLLIDQQKQADGQMFPLSLGYFVVFKNILDSYMAEKQRLSAPKQQSGNIQKPSLNDTLKKGITVTLSSVRLSFAPEITTLRIKKDENDTLLISGISKDSKQQIHFEYNQTKIKFELKTEKFARSYQNTPQNKFTYRDLKSPSETRRNNDLTGNTVCSELSAVLDKIKRQYKQNNNKSLTGPDRDSR